MAANSGSNEGRYIWKFTVANLVYLPKVEILSKLPLLPIFALQCMYVYLIGRGAM